MSTALTPSRRHPDIDSSSVISTSLCTNRLSSYDDKIMEDKMNILINVMAPNYSAKYIIMSNCNINKMQTG